MTRTRPEWEGEQQADVAIIGGGVAGLSLALSLPTSLHIALLTKGALGESNTRYAQGGLAAAVGSDDSPELHLRDTLTAGAGLCDETAVRLLVEQAPDAVRWLIDIGAQFDRKASSQDAAQSPEETSSEQQPGNAFDAYVMGREAAHSRWRVLHAHGDATGAEIERALVAAVRSRENITVYRADVRAGTAGASMGSAAVCWRWTGAARGLSFGHARRFWQMAALAASGCAPPTHQSPPQMVWRWPGVQALRWPILSSRSFTRQCWSLTMIQPS